MSEREPYLGNKPIPDGSNPSGKQDNWERDMLRKLAFSAITEQRRSRRWGIFFKLMFLVYLVALLYLYLPDGSSGSVPIGNHTALIDISGLISEDSTASADNIASSLKDAFESKGTKGVILRANSPGGSPVQAAYMYDEISRLRKKHPDVPVYAVISDVCASACYYIIAASDKIYANEASLVGSIGVLFDGFGYVELMDKLGIERRLHTAGKNKGIMDPFSPEKKDEVKHLNTMLDEIHQQFISAVKKGRGERLADNPDIYSGLFWSGAKSKELGLIDDFASAGKVAREIIKEEKIVDYSPRQDLFDRLADSFGASVVRNLVPAQQGKSPLR